MTFTGGENSCNSEQSYSFANTIESLDGSIELSDIEGQLEDDTVQFLGQSPSSTGVPPATIAYLDDDDSQAMLIDPEYDDALDWSADVIEHDEVEILEILPEYPEYESIDLADEHDLPDLMDFDDADNDLDL